jgi:hypothetical protein
MIDGPAQAYHTKVYPPWAFGLGLGRFVRSGVRSTPLRSTLWCAPFGRLAAGSRRSSDAGRILLHRGSGSLLPVPTATVGDQHVRRHHS